MLNSSFDWQVISASVTGTSHQKNNLTCQDAHGFRRVSDTLVIAVADGAGSAPLADIGAKIAVETALDSLEQILAQTGYRGAAEYNWSESLRGVLQASQQALIAEATTQETELRHLATTLILVVATPELVAVAQVGDGATVIEDAEGCLLALTTPASGEYLNETTFLISPQAITTAQFNIWKGKPKYLATFSDGLQMVALKMPESTPHAPFFSPLFKFIANVNNQTEATDQLVSFLRSPRLTAKTDDDLTLVLAMCNEG